MASLTVSASASTLSGAQGFHSRSGLQKGSLSHGTQMNLLLHRLPASVHPCSQLLLKSPSGLCPSTRKSLLGSENCAVRRHRSYGAISPRASSETESEEKEKIPFGSTRKDVLLVGLGITVFGFALKYGLQAAGLDALKAGNVVQVTLVLGLMLGWLSTYLFRVGGKQMTYVQQLKDYEDAVMKKRLEEMPEAELESMLAEIEEEKRRLKEKRKA